MKKISLSKMYVDEAIKQDVCKVIDSGRYIDGPNLKKFEEEFASFCGTRYAVGVSSGTSAVLLSLMALGITDNDEVIVPSLTFIATATPARFLRANLIYAEIDAGTYTIDPVDIEKKITSNTRVIIPVHLYGQPCDMDGIRRLAERYGLFVIEDACQAHGAKYKTKRIGSLGDLACFSFFPSKNMTVLGDGGMITTDNAELARKLVMLRSHGREQKYVHDLLSLNFRLSELHAAIGLQQLKHVNGWNIRRREIAGKYGALLRDTGVVIPAAPQWSENVYHMYVIRTGQRDKLAQYLKDKGIETGIHYPVPVHRQPCLKPDPGISLPITERYVGEILSLPVHPQLSDDEVEYVAAEIKNFMRSI